MKGVSAWKVGERALFDFLNLPVTIRMATVIEDAYGHPHNAYLAVDDEGKSYLVGDGDLDVLEGDS